MSSTPASPNPGPDSLPVVTPPSAEPTPIPPGAARTNEPVSQAPEKRVRPWVPAWWRQLPAFGRFNPFDDKFQLIEPKQLQAMLAEADPAAAARMRHDLDVLEHEVLRLFRRLDYEAARQQNRFRRVQIQYAFLALVATILGSIMALTLESHPQWTPVLGFAETFVALFTAFIVTVTSDEPPQQLWLQNRLRAEHLRREYFRYLMRLKPYDAIADQFDRETLLAKRAADINRGFFPDQPIQVEGA
jgi:hypothetical protein